MLQQAELINGIIFQEAEFILVGFVPARPVLDVRGRQSWQCRSVRVSTPLQSTVPIACDRTFPDTNGVAHSYYVSQLTRRSEMDGMLSERCD